MEQRKNTFTPFEKGQKVWLDTWNMKTTYHKKMTLKWEGPFKIEEVLGPVNYQLELPNTWKVHNVFHVVLLKPYQENEVYGENFPTPPPEIINGEEVYQVKTILKQQVKRPRMSIPDQMGRIPYFGSLVGTGKFVFQRQRFIGPLQETTSNMKMFAARQTLKWPRPCFRPTLLTILEEGEIHGHHVEVKKLIEMEQIIDEILDDYFCPPHVYPTLYTFLDKFLWRVDKHTTEILNKRFIS